MKLTNEQINAKAGQILGYCDHDWSGEEEVEHYEVGSGGPLVLSKCVHCFAYEDGGDWDELPDFCTDLNAAQRLVKEVGRSRRGRYELSGTLSYLLFGDRDYPSDTDIADALLLPAKTITLAALVAAGKISIEDAKASVEEG